MTRIHYALGLLLLVATTYANEINDDTDIDPRFFFLNNNSTSLSVSFASLIYGLFALLALGLLAALLAFFLFGSGGEETGYSTGTSYSSYGSGRAAAYVHSHARHGQQVEGLVLGTWTMHAR